MSKKISELPVVVAANMSDSDVLPVVSGGITYKSALSELRQKITSVGAADAGAVDLRYPIGNAKRYGAKGDGATDDTVALQAWLNAGTLVGRLPAGNYKISDVLTQTGQMSIFGDGINNTTITQTTANKGALQMAAGGRSYVTWSGFKAVGAGFGAGTSVGVQMGDTTYGTDYCNLLFIEATNFGLANVKLVNGFRCHVDEVYPHGDPAGILTAATIGLHLLGTYAFAGSNYDNRIGTVEAYNNVTDLKVENGGENIFYKKVYCYNQLFTGTLHNIWELNSSLNSWRYTKLEALSLSAGGTSMWLIEATATNPYTNMLGPSITEFEYENGTQSTTVDVIEIGTAAGNTVYGTRIEFSKFMPVSGGRYHVVMHNESLSRIAHNAHRDSATPFSNIIRELTIYNPNALTNLSYVGSAHEDSYGAWTPTLLAGAASLATLTGRARWTRSGKRVFWDLDVVLSAKTGNVGTVTLRGLQAISPNAGTTVFGPQAAGFAIPLIITISGLATAYPVTGYVDTSTMYITFYNAGNTAGLTDTSFANGTHLMLAGSFEVA